jgi:hypothetical protein
VGLGGEQHVMALAGGEMTQGLGQVTFPGAAPANNILLINTLPKRRFIIASILFTGSPLPFSAVIAFVVKRPTWSSSLMDR